MAFIGTGRLTVTTRASAFGSVRVNRNRAVVLGSTATDAFLVWVWAFMALSIGYFNESLRCYKLYLFGFDLLS